jgi:Ca2+-binding EF-hand superfamily protein
MNPKELLTNEELITFTKFFHQLDKNGDGKLDKDEFNNLLARIEKKENLLKNKSTLTIIDLFKFAFSVNEKATIDINQMFLFIKWNKLPDNDENKMKIIFNLIDNDNNGYIDRKELEHYITFVDKGRKPNEHQLDIYMKQADVNNDQLISFDEFKKIWIRPSTQLRKNNLIYDSTCSVTIKKVKKPIKVTSSPTITNQQRIRSNLNSVFDSYSNIPATVNSTKSLNTLEKKGASPQLSINSQTSTKSSKKRVYKKRGSLPIGNDRSYNKSLHNLSKSSKAKEIALAGFRLFDKNNDGFIDINEMKLYYNTFGPKISNIEIKNIFKQTDQNNDNLIDFEEFFKMWQDAESNNNSDSSDLESSIEASSEFVNHQTEEEKALGLFRMIDINRDGSIDKNEIKTFYSVFGHRDLTDNEIDNIFKKYNTKNNDGKITLEG